ncbi:MAG: antitoxin [Polyangiales bacterium]
MPESDSAQVRHAALFQNGRNQAVRIPREFELPGEQVIIRREGRCLVLEPVPARPALAELFASFEGLDEVWERPADPATEAEDIFV